MTPEQFFDGRNYHPVREELAILVHSLGNKEEFADKFGIFLRENPGPKFWLPTKIDQVDRMETQELYWRFATNIADERWVDGALDEPFRSGTLLIAMERFVDEIESIPLNQEGDEL